MSKQKPYKLENTTYMKEIKAAGLDVPPYEAKRFRAMLVNFDHFKGYLKEHIYPMDAPWMRSIIEGSEGYKALEKDLGGFDIANRARQEIKLILEDSTKSDKEKAEATSKWLLKWASEKGIVKLRAAINNIVFTKKSKRASISVYLETRERLYQIMDERGATTTEEFLNELMDTYELATKGE